MQVRPLKRIQPFALLPSPKLAMRHIWLDVTTLVGIAKEVSIVGKRDLVSASSPSIDRPGGPPSSTALVHHACTDSMLVLLAVDRGHTDHRRPDAHRLHDHR